MNIFIHYGTRDGLQERVDRNREKFSKMSIEQLRSKAKREMPLDEDEIDSMSKSQLVERFAEAYS